MKNKRNIAILAFCLFTYYVFGQNKVACIGNSITYGHGIENRDQNSYPAQLQEILGNKFIVKNFGISARTMLKNGDRPYWKEKEFEAAKAFSPDIVIIMLGTNDAKLTLNWNPRGNELESDYKDMVDEFTKLPSQPKLFICRVVPAVKDNWEITDSIIKTGINPTIEKVAFDKGVNLIDLYSALSGHPEWYLNDGIHPNKEGAAQMAVTISKSLKHDPIPISMSKTNRLKTNKASYYQWYYNGSPVPTNIGGKKRKIKVFGQGNYKVAIQNDDDSFTRFVSKNHILK